MLWELGSDIIYFYVKYKASGNINSLMRCFSDKYKTMSIISTPLTSNFS